MKHFGKAFLIGFILVDIPVFTAVVILGMFYGFQHVFLVVMDYRQEHLWTLLPSVFLFVYLLVRTSNKRQKEGLRNDPGTKKTKNDRRNKERTSHQD